MLNGSAATRVAITTGPGANPTDRKAAAAAALPTVGADWPSRRTPAAYER